jgi:hypothetical protein
MPGYGAGIETDRTRPRQLPADAGFADGFKTTMLTRKGATSGKLYVSQQDQLASIGVEAPVNVQEAGQSP